MRIKSRLRENEFSFPSKECTCACRCFCFKLDICLATFASHLSLSSDAFSFQEGSFLEAVHQCFQRPNRVEFGVHGGNRPGASSGTGYGAVEQLRIAFQRRPAHETASRPARCDRPFWSAESLSEKVPHLNQVVHALREFA
jgi:hypothetical protein